MTDELPTLAELNEFFQQSPFNDWLDIAIESADSECSVVTVPHDEKLTNPDGLIHGGVLAAVMDVTAGATLKAAIDDPDGTTLVTTDMNIQYLQPASGDLRAEGHVERAGSSMGVATVDIRNLDATDDREKAATGSVSYRLL